jgi:type II secretory pathway component PulK
MNWQASLLVGIVLIACAAFLIAAEVNIQRIKRENERRQAAWRAATERAKRWNEPPPPPPNILQPR